MKVIIPILSVVEAGGVKVLFKIADLLQDNGYEVSIISFNNKKRQKINFNTKIHITYMEVNPILKIICKWILGDFIKCWYIFKKMPICDIAIANYFLTAYPVWLSKRPKYKLYYCQAYEPEFFYDYGQKFKPICKYILIKIYKFLYRKLAENSYKLGLAMFANNEKIVSRIENLTRKSNINIPIVHSGIETKYFKPQWNENNILNVGVIATPNYWKGTKYFLEGVHMLKKRNINFKISCAFGPPPEGSPEVEAHWVNPRSQEELAKFYASLDILVSPMLITGEFALPPLEAMACGTAVISTKLLYAQHKQDYYEICPKNSVAIADAIEELINNKELRIKISKNGYELSRRFCWENIEKELLNFMANIPKEQQRDFT